MIPAINEQKFHILIVMLLGCCFHSNNDFLKLQSPLSTTPAINYRRCLSYWRLFAGVIVTGDKFIAGVMESLQSRTRPIIYQ
jgi:hypothetical protein